MGRTTLTDLALLRQLRPKQWTKNLLVVAPAGAAGDLVDVDVWIGVLGAFVAMCFAASSTYVVNDINDIEADRQHPEKRHRPLASGAISVSTGRVLAVACSLGALGVGIALGRNTLFSVIAYLLITYSYTYALKHVPVIELVTVAIGFPLRAIVGGQATDTPLTTNFLLVVGSGALFVVAAKRAEEIRALGHGAASHRTTLGTYSEGYLRMTQGISLSVMLVVYGLWTFGGEVSSSSDSIVWFQLSMIPLVVVVLRYAWLVDRGMAGAPEDVFLHDRMMWLLSALWAISYGVGVGVG